MRVWMCPKGEKTCGLREKSEIGNRGCFFFVSNENCQQKRECGEKEKSNVTHQFSCGPRMLLTQNLVRVACIIPTNCTLVEALGTHSDGMVLVVYPSKVCVFLNLIEKNLLLLLKIQKVSDTKLSFFSTLSHTVVISVYLNRHLCGVVHDLSTCIL